MDHCIWRVNVFEDHYQGTNRKADFLVGFYKEKKNRTTINFIWSQIVKFIQNLPSLDLLFNIFLFCTFLSDLNLMTSMVVNKNILKQHTTIIDIKIGVVITLRSR